jgi:hypothetical protein
MDGDHLTLITRATPKVLAVLPGLEGRRTWLKGGGLKVEGTKHNLGQLRAAFPDLDIQGATADVELFDAPPAPVQFTFKRKPDPHQLTAFERLQKRRAFGMFMEQGTGKTKVAIDRACQLFSASAITGVLVVTKKGVHRQWVDAELPKDHGPPYKADWWRGKPLPDDLKVQGDDLKWFSINYDALRGKGFDAAAQFCAAHRGKLLIVADESQCIMNHTSLRHKAMMTLKPLSSHRLVLTGTPIAKDLTDEWAQLKWLDENIIGIKYLTTFRAQYCIMGGFEGRQVVGQKNMDAFKAKVAPHTYRVTKAEIGYIPKHYSDWVYDLAAEQRRLMLQVKQELLADLGDGEVVPISSATAAFTKAQQIANGFIIDEEGKVLPLMPVAKNPRIVAALEWLDSHEGKAVVWTRFIADRAMLAEALHGAGIAYAEYSGGDEERHNAKRSFIEGDARVFLANPQSAGTGTDGLQTVCTQALYYSNSFNSIDRWQSEDRIDRRGMIGGANYTDLIGKGGPDRYILRNLKKKKGLSAMSLGDISEAFEFF